MTNPTTANIAIHPQDGWVELASGGATAFLRVSHIPHHIPLFLYVGSSAPSTSPAQATGSVVFSTGVPTNGQTVVIGTETYTFVTSGSAPFDVVIGGTYLLTATAFAAAVNANSTLVTASDTSGTVTLTAIASGPNGNYTVSTSATHIAGTSLTGGALANGGFRDDCASTHFDGAYSGNLYGRIMNNSNDKVVVSIWQL
jgi:phage tail sheath gpL-like